MPQDFTSVVTFEVLDTTCISSESSSTARCVEGNALLCNIEVDGFCRQLWLPFTIYISGINEMLCWQPCNGAQTQKQAVRLCQFKPSTAGLTVGHS